MSYLSMSKPSSDTLLAGDDLKNFNENNNRTLCDVWTERNFVVRNDTNSTTTMNTWSTSGVLSYDDGKDEKIEIEDEGQATSPSSCEKDDSLPTSPSHHARRPMNAFLIFCKKHRPIVRQKFPTLENRGVTRILGEWWALLDDGEKSPYTNLAKEYKDAFLSANPDFKWYKLPAPPLRTLNIRPTSVGKLPSPLSSPTTISVTNTPTNTINVSTLTPSSPESIFTPGKLADESQLGSLTTLMNNFSSTPKTNNNNNDECTRETNNNNNQIRSSPPPKPIKKRIFHRYLDDDDHQVARNLTIPDEDEATNNVTNQELMNKVVDRIYRKQDSDDESDPKSKEIRKSGRQCKGKRYEQFMVEGKLLSGKKDGKMLSQKFALEFDYDTAKCENKLSTETPKLDLDYTIKRLAERTNVKLMTDARKMDDEEKAYDAQMQNSVRNQQQQQQTNFNLDLRISNLPSLSYDTFSLRKKESKKRKNRTKMESEPKNKMGKIGKNDTQMLVGSKKRKNKHSITHLRKKLPDLNNELIGLATLAEVAANIEKIDDTTTNE